MSETMNPDRDETAGGGAESIPEPLSPDGAPERPGAPDDPRDMPHESNPLNGADAGDMEPEDWNDDEA